MDLCLVDPPTGGIRRLIFHRLALKLAALDVFALFSVWYHAHWEFVKQLIDLAWAQRFGLPPVHDTGNLDVLHPLLITIAACLLVALYLLNLSRYRRGQFGANLRRFQEANAHAHAIDHRIANSKIMFKLPERGNGVVQGGKIEPWQPPTSLL